MLRVLIVIPFSIFIYHLQSLNQNHLNKMSKETSNDAPYVSEVTWCARLLEHATVTVRPVGLLLPLGATGVPRLLLSRAIGAGSGSADCWGLTVIVVQELLPTD